MLHQYYLKIKETRETFVFNQLHTEQRFLDMLKRILDSSPNQQGIYVAG